MSATQTLSPGATSSPYRILAITCFFLFFGFSIPLVVVLPAIRLHDIWKIAASGQPALLGPDLSLMVPCAIGLYYLFFGAVMRELWADRIWVRPLLLHGAIATFVLTLTAHGCYIAAGSGDRTLTVATAVLGLIAWRIAVSLCVALAPGAFGLPRAAPSRPAVVVLSAVLAVLAGSMAVLWVANESVKAPQPVPHAATAAATPHAVAAEAVVAAPSIAAASAATAGRDFTAEASADIAFINPATVTVDGGKASALVGKHPAEAMGAPGVESAFRDLLGKDYAEFGDNLSVGSEVKSPQDGEFFGVAMAPHSGFDQAACWSIDAQGRLRAALIDKSRPRKVQIYGAARLNELPSQIAGCVSEARN